MKKARAICYAIPSISSERVIYSECKDERITSADEVSFGNLPNITLCKFIVKAE